MAKHLSTLHRTSIFMVGAILLLAPGSAFGFSGFLTSADGGINGTGNWIVNGPTTISWDVTYDTVNSWWDYSYSFSHPVGETSHFILEVSDNFTANDLFALSGDFGSIEINTYEEGGSNPNLPGEIYGIKFDEAWGLDTQISFSSYRVPVWQDFYSKSVRAGGHGWNTAWNGGFSAADPTNPAGNGSIANHILAPDSVTEPIPEPTTMLLLGGGLIGLAAFRRKRSA